MARLSDVDIAIIRALQDDGRLPYSTVAQRAGISEAHVRRRVRALLDADVIAITAVADPRAFGLNSMAWLALCVEPTRIEDVANQLLALPAIDYVVITAGELNVMAEVACRSGAELYDLLLSVRSTPGVARTETFVYLRLLRQNFEWKREREPTSSVARGVAPLPDLDASDIGLIQALQRNGRASFRDIAHELGMSERAASGRYRRLVDARAVQVTAVVNPFNLGFGAAAWLGIRTRAGADFEQVATALTMLPEVSYLVVASGRYDLMAEVVCADSEDLIATVAKSVGRIDGIALVDTYYYLRLLYRTTAGAWSAARSLAIGPRASDESALDATGDARSSADGSPPAS